jgi:hypothetical protein
MFIRRIQKNRGRNDTTEPCLAVYVANRAETEGKRWMQKMIKKTISIIALTGITVAAVIQWKEIMGRLWQLCIYFGKFYDGNLHSMAITAGRDTFQVFIVATLISIVCGLATRWWLPERPRFFRKLNTIVVVTLVLGGLTWTILVASPLVELRGDNGITVTTIKE